MPSGRSFGFHATRLHPVNISHPLYISESRMKTALTAVFGLGTGLAAPSVLGRGEDREDLPNDAADRLRR